MSTPVAVVTARSSPAGLPSPITPANEGKMQCYTPDAARKTCRSIASYALRADGGIDNLAIVLVVKEPQVVMRTTTVVQVKANQVCGTIRKEDIDTATFTVNDASASAEQTAKLRQQMQVAEQGVLGHEICTAYIAEGSAFRIRVSIDGLEQHREDDKVIWVSPADGYKVAP